MHNDRPFIRWQQTTRKQLSYSINLILSFSIMVLGFGLTLLTKSHIEFSILSKVFFILSLIFVLISLSSGVFAVISRLLDFRTTTKIARKKEKNDSSRIDELRKKARELGSYTWILFWVQIGSFLLATLFMTISIMYLYKEELFLF